MKIDAGTPLSRLLLLLAATVATMLPVAGAQPITGVEATPQTNAPSQAYQATRADLGHAYLRFERALQANPQTGEDLVRVTRGFDELALSLFGGGYSSALRQMNALTEMIVEPGPDAPSESSRRLADSVRAAVEPVVFGREGGATPMLRLDRLYRLPRAQREAMTGPVDLEVRIVRAGDGETPVFSTTVRIESEAELPVPRPLALAPETLPTGAYDVRIGAAGGDLHTTARWFIVDGSLDERRERNIERIDTLEAEGVPPRLAGALETLRARNALMGDHPSPMETEEFMADQAALPAAIDAEIAAIAARENPYRNYHGDLWRVVPIAGAVVPVRVYNPPEAPVDSDADPGHGLRPLVIALHGAGGDEHMFMDAYGAGLLKRLADEHGFVVVTPRNNAFASNPIYFDALVAAMVADYPIDTSRIYVVGHSMGAGVTAAWTRMRGDSIAAAACIAGFTPARGRAGSERIPPTLIIAAEFDGLIPTSRVKPAAEAAIAAGLPFEFRLIPNEGHTTVVGVVLPDVVEWLLEHRRGDQ